MKTVVVLRHAKSDWSDVGLRDFDRGLNDRGCRAADVMGHWAARERMRFDAILASPAKRVVETLHRFREVYGSSPEPRFDLRIYLASAASIAEVIAETAPEVTRLLVAGHSPGLEAFILEATGPAGGSALRDAVEMKFPTAAMAVLEFDIEDWAELGEDFADHATLRAFTRPRDLDPALGPDR